MNAISQAVAKQRAWAMGVVALTAILAIVAFATLSRVAEGQRDSGVVTLADETRFSEHWRQALDVRTVADAVAIREEIRSGDAWGVAIEGKHLDDVSEADLREWAQSGIVIVGIGVPLQELVSAVRTAGGLVDLDEATAEGGLAPFEGVRTEPGDGTYFSYLARTSANVLAQTGCATTAAGNRWMHEESTLDIAGLRLVAIAHVKNDPSSDSSSLACY